MLPLSTEVLIVGAGPTGLALAIRLQKAGIPHMVIDRAATGQNTSRAAVVHAHTLECIADLGVTDSLVSRGLSLPHFVIRDRDRALFHLDFSQLPSRFPFLLMIPQDETERVLESRLQALGGAVRRNARATAFAPHSDAIISTIATPTGDVRVRSRYVVGADGMHSAVRAAAGIEFTGDTYEDSFVLADVEMAWPLGREEVSLFFSPQGLVVVAPLPNGAYRIVATVESASENPTTADIQSLLAERGPRNGLDRMRNVIWSSRFRVHHRLADAYRQGRFLLMGDAAHVHSPAGGQGMNTGLVDASVLGALLTDIISGRRPESALEMYGALRRPAAAQVLNLAGRLTDMATVRGPVRRRVRNLALWAGGHIPALKRRILMNLSGLARSSHAELPPPQDAADSISEVRRAA
jgi:2-polyprenyl-6-methoxyphenol hydroxylase-like FAD-dependent oxidoreductase